MGERERNVLEKSVTVSSSVEGDLKSQIKVSKARSAELADQIEELDARLRVETAEKKRLEVLLAQLESDRRPAAGELRIRIDDERNKIRAELEALSAARMEELKSRIAELEEEKKRIESSVIVKKEDDAKTKATLAQMELVGSRNRELEARLAKEQEARVALEAALEHYRLTAKRLEEKLARDASLLDSEMLADKLKQARLSLAKASASGADDELVKGLNADIGEVEKLISVSGEKRLEMQELLKEELSALSDEGPGIERKDASSVVDRLRRGMLDQSKEEFQHRVSSLETRLVSLEKDKKLIEDSWGEALQAVVRLDETAKKIESSVKSDDAQLKPLDVASLEGPSKIKSDIEGLKAARESVKVAMDKVRGAIKTSMDAEAKRTLDETVQVSGMLSRMAGDVDIAPEKVELKVGAIDGQKPSSPEAIEAGKLKIKDLSRVIDELFKDRGEAGAIMAERFKKQVAESSGTLMDCEDQLKALMAGKKPFDVYVVRAGDSLWNIAAKKEVYSNGNLWPILFKSNNFIKDPDLIEPDTSIFIRRDASPQEMADAVNEAKQYKVKRPARAQ